VGVEHKTWCHGVIDFEPKTETRCHGVIDFTTSTLLGASPTTMRVIVCRLAVSMTATELPRRSLM
jgi:hypothetical protein